jgi:hypothetical protein
MESEQDTWITADGFDDAIIGIAHPWQANQRPVAVYNARKCIEILMKNMDCDHDEAMEYFEFNVAGSYVGEQTPIYVFPGEW